MKAKKGASERPPKKLRTGFTTGACAQAATRAAMIALLFQKEVREIEVVLPNHQKTTFEIKECRFNAESATAAVIKDAGDDPDVTHGARIRVTVSWKETLGVEVDRGEGVGLITKRGLGLEVGSPAINPVPMKMIRQEVEAAVGEPLEERGVRVVVSVPGGEEMAKKTENDRLGIVGGISILGTTGIVIPFSTAAYKISIAQAIDVARAAGLTRIVLTTGGQSEKFAMEAIKLPVEAFIQMGDFCGFSLKSCAQKGIETVTIAGLVGKLSKIAMGVFQTHAAGSSVDLDFLVRLARESGASEAACEEARLANTARGFAEVMIEHRVPGVFDRICREICVKASEHVRSQAPAARMSVEAIITGFMGGVLGRSPKR
jgi:cobalt-precorrin-5B (C1)-methyltransferase